MERIPASERTREKLKAMFEGSSDVGGTSELVRLAARLIIEEALEGEARDALGRDYYARGAAPGAGHRNGYRAGRLRSAEGAIEYSAPFVAWDLLALGDDDLRNEPLAVRRERLEHVLAGAAPPVHLSPATRDRALAADWFRRFEGAGLDGVMAKRLDAPYRAGERTMIKVKHERTADCVVAGFRWHKKGAGAMIGSLLLGLYDDDHTLHHVGVAAAFTATVRKQLVVELTPLRADALEDHPWRDWAVAQEEASAKGQRLPGATSRWNRGKDLSWEPLRPERVCEVAYDHMQGTRFRHAAKFLRWRPDKRPSDCHYDQLEVTPAYELDRVFGARDGSQPCGAAGQGS